VKTENLEVEFYLGFDTGYAGKNSLFFEKKFLKITKKVSGPEI
jgi:hypothetical protein